MTGDHNGHVSDYTAICFGIDKAAFNQGINAQHGFSIENDLQPTLTQRPGAVCENYFVRRLTPLECERLQGYPDNWTLIGEPCGFETYEYDDCTGHHECKLQVYKYRDENGKLHKVSDAARYKALGNSIALPFWFALLRRISAIYDRPATLGSLFDGIGGFPLCWERCNGLGTALWASEIEPFPIQVTRIRFPGKGNEISKEKE